MLRPRLIPCLLINSDGLLKTKQFAEPVYVGDPINAVRIFNEKEADELIVLDIDATRKNVEPNYKLIEALAAECRMPLCYGGGIVSAAQASRIISLGVEKIALSAGAVENLKLVSEVAASVGRQSVVAVLDVKRKKSLFGAGYRVFTHNGTRDSGLEPVEYAKRLESSGAGEIVINSIDHDGMMCGYDINLATEVRRSISIPMSVLGGAGALDDAVALWNACGTVGAVAGSLFVFKGRYRAVLINYPGMAEREQLYTKLESK